ncbi:MAG: NAD(+) synthase, partial [Betaproteobacteria bacterium]|nr:NAD(+) synthase [Betaproteobacteria bacterium]
AGYPPEDLLLRPAFYRSGEMAFDRLLSATQAWPDLVLVVGQAVERAGCRHNAATVVRGGQVIAEYFKQELPNYDVFDEQRYFTPGRHSCVIEVRGIQVGILICEDFWRAEVPARAREEGAELILALNASPYHLDKQPLRLETARANVCSLGCALIAANLVGGQDELVFDGGSFALDAQGTIRAQARQFATDLLLVDVVDADVAKGGRASALKLSGRIEPALPLDEQVYSALVLGVRDYLGKNGFPGALLGLSGGVDFEAFHDLLANELVGRSSTDTTEENLQARIRGTLLMALSNRHGSIVLTTGNKSEMATGYCTLYGDMAGGFAVIKDLLKTTVWRLCRWRNGHTPAMVANAIAGEIIPSRIIDRPPSAELRPEQTDQDSLPPYDLLDGILELYMEQGLPAEDVVAAGFPPEAVSLVVRLMRINEYKRRQAPVGIRVTHRGFGRDWRYPITSRFRESIPTA